MGHEDCWTQCLCVSSLWRLEHSHTLGLKTTDLLPDGSGGQRPAPVSLVAEHCPAQASEATPKSRVLTKGTGPSGMTQDSLLPVVCCRATSGMEPNASSGSGMRAHTSLGTVVLQPAVVTEGIKEGGSLT